MDKPPQIILSIMMTEAVPHERSKARDEGLSLFSLASIMLGKRWWIFATTTFGLIVGLVSGLLKPRVYASSATFLPQGTQGTESNFALAANQLGIRVPTSGGTWGPPMYVELLHSRAILEPIVGDSVAVTEQGGRQRSLVDLLEIEAPSELIRTDQAVRRLQGVVAATEVKALGAVRVTATTKWPSVSLAIARRLVERVNQFNVDTRKSQASAERQFVEVQAAEANISLRSAEDRIQKFLQQNRDIAASPQLSFERDRLQRDVAIRQQLYSSWMQSREEARVREVRDIPVITMLEVPQLPLVGESRGTVMRGLVGSIVGALFGIMIALLGYSFSAARQSVSEDSLRFFQSLDDATPRFLKTVMRTVSSSQSSETKEGGG